MAKKIWDTLKTAHEGDKVTKITRMELIEGELKRFAINKGEGPQEMHNPLEMLVNQILNLGSTKWTGHKVVKIMLWSLVSRNAAPVTLLRENPRYEVMTPRGGAWKFLSHGMMVKDSKHVDDLHQGNIPNTKPQAIAFKTTSEKQEGAPSMELPIDLSKLNNEEMALVIKRFQQILKMQKWKDYKSHAKRVLLLW